jgi:hypothetical protein
VGIDKKDSFFNRLFRSDFVLFYLGCFCSEARFQARDGRLGRCFGVCPEHKGATNNFNPTPLRFQLIEN